MSRKESSSTAVAKGHRFQRRGFSYEKGIRFFFASNAGLTIVILALIIAFLLKEGLGFFPGYQRELQVYRVAGLEFVDISRKNLTAHEELASVLNRAYYAEINGQAGKEMKRSQEASALYNAFTEQVAPTRDLILNNAGIDAASHALVVMKGNYEKQKAKALSALPPTPHLTETERKDLIASLAGRTIEDSEEPPFVTSLSAQFAAVQEKFAQPLLPLRETIDAFATTGEALGTLVSEMTESVIVTKEALQKADIIENDRNSLMAAAKSAKNPEERAKLTAEAEASIADRVDTEAPIQQLLLKRPDAIAIHQTLRESAGEVLKKLPESLTQPEANRLLKAARNAAPLFLADLEKTPAVLEAWKNDKPVGLFTAVRSFLTGKDWVTGGEWQDFYGILPLFVGSLMISVVALLIAIPTGIGAAIYTNQFASRHEQGIIKPVIEFIQAIPSVVLGFIGILVFGTVLRDLSMHDSLSWVPGFPIEERLNIFTAGCLLALMSIPTIFSLAEDALNNVPSAYSEAAEALGASKVQNTFRVMIPAAFSGILAAVLLGFGRVIGETMVVLLVAGNRIKIPDFTAGLGTFFQPAHTLTGIIAQELGEVPLGSVHYRALFVVGILLFAIVLAINATAHRFVKKVKH
jgi:phosphate transport system permease protein